MFLIYLCGKQFRLIKLNLCVQYIYIIHKYRVYVELRHKSVQEMNGHKVYIIIIVYCVNADYVQTLNSQKLLLLNRLCFECISIKLHINDDFLDSDSSK